MFKLLAFASLAVAARAYLNHGSPLPIYGHYGTIPAPTLMPHHPNLLQTYGDLVPTPAYTKNLQTPYTGAAKPTVQVVTPDYLRKTSYSPIASHPAVAPVPVPVPGHAPGHLPAPVPVPTVPGVHTLSSAGAHTPEVAGVAAYPRPYQPAFAHPYRLNFVRSYQRNYVHPYQLNYGHSYPLTAYGGTLPPAAAFTVNHMGHPRPIGVEHGW